MERIESTIPLEPVLADVVTLADPGAPRILDFDGNGSPDVALFLGNELHIFKNSAADADVLIVTRRNRKKNKPETAPASAEG